MALDDAAFDNELASSFLVALRINTGVKGSRDAIRGNSYSSGYFFGEVLQDETVNVYVENPQDSGVVLFPNAAFNTTGLIRYNKVDSVTVDSAGTAVPSQNRLLNNGTTSANIEYNISWSGGEAWTEKISGDSDRKLASTSVDFDIILDEGDNVVYQLTNVSSSDEQCGIDVDYVEVPRNELNEFLG